MSTCNSLKDRLTDAIAGVQECLDSHYSITLDQVEELADLKDELELAQTDLEEASIKVDEIESVIDKSYDTQSNADTMR